MTGAIVISLIWWGFIIFFIIRSRIRYKILRKRVERLENHMTNNPTDPLPQVIVKPKRDLFPTHGEEKS